MNGRLARIERRVPVKRFPIRVLTGVAAASLFFGTAVGAAAASVDPSTLTPPPPPDARCHTAGNQTICDTVLNFDMENEPAFDAPCGTPTSPARTTATASATTTATAS
jgi:hypothetical protein